MEDSDDEIFFGAITDHEKLVASKICRETLTPIKKRSSSCDGVGCSGDARFGVLDDGNYFGGRRRRLSFNKDEDKMRNTNLQTNDVDIASLCNNMRTCCSIDTSVITKSESTFACSPSLASNSKHALSSETSCIVNNLKHTDTISLDTSPVLDTVSSGLHAPIHDSPEEYPSKNDTYNQIPSVSLKAFDTEHGSEFECNISDSEQAESNNGKTMQQGAQSNTDNACGNGDYNECFLSSPRLAYVVNSDNRVNVSSSLHLPGSEGDINLQTTSLSANYVHVLKSSPNGDVYIHANNAFYGSETGSECNPGYINPVSSLIEDETDSVLLSSELENSSDDSDESGLNDTIDAVDFILNHGLDYVMDSDVSINSFQELSYDNLYKKEAVNPVISSEGSASILTHSNISNECSDEPSQENEQYAVCGANNALIESVSARGTKFRTPRPPIKHIQRSMKSKVGHYSNVVSPVAAYIKNGPLPPLITTKRTGESWTDKNPKSLNAISNLKFGMSSPFRRQNLNAPLPSLPVVAYEKVPVVNVNNPGLVMHHPPLKSQPSTPKVTKHTGRALLSSIHQRPTPAENNSEVSVIYAREVSKTSTLQ